MKKAIVVIVLAVVAGLVVSGCSKSDSTTKTVPTTVTTEAPVVQEPTTTTTEAPVAYNNDAEVAAKCVDALGTVSDGLDTIQTGVALLPSVSDADAKEFLATAKEFVTASIQTVKLCAYLSPYKAAQTIDSLESLNRAIDAAAALY